ncbi:MAG: hypothetical protein ACI8RZ_002656 [Myxococcota bacterium]|jgi:hypothetical protein
MSDQKPEGLVQMVTALQSINEQIGGHVIGALQRPNTAAVISMVVPSVGPDQIISVPLEAKHFQAIQGLLATMSGPSDLSKAARQAIGFGREGEE